MRRFLEWRSGFTVGEIVIVIVVMGVLALVAAPIYTGIRRASLENAATQAARVINAARDGYALTVPAASANWNSAADDTARLELLVREGFLTGAPGDYLTMAGNYSLVLGGEVRAKTTLRCSGISAPY